MTFTSTKGERSARPSPTVDRIRTLDVRKCPPGPKSDPNREAQTDRGLISCPALAQARAAMTKRGKRISSLLHRPLQAFGHLLKCSLSSTTTRNSRPLGRHRHGRDIILLFYFSFTICSGQCGHLLDPPSSMVVTFNPFFACIFCVPAC
jgi:hypothetical protein